MLQSKYGLGLYHKDCVGVSILFAEKCFGFFCREFGLSVKIIDKAYSRFDLKIAFTY